MTGGASTLLREDSESALAPRRPGSTKDSGRTSLRSVDRAYLSAIEVV